MFRDDDFVKPVGRDRLRDALNWYAAEAEKAEAGPGLFGEGADPARTLTLVRERMYGDGPRADEIDLDAQAEAPPPRPAKGEAGWRISPEEIAARGDIEAVRLAPAWGALSPVARRNAARAWIKENIQAARLRNADMGWDDISVGSSSTSKMVSA